MGPAADKCGGAVNRVNHPLPRRGGAPTAAFFADKPVFGEPLQQQIFKRLLGFAVGHRNRRLVGLAVDAKRGAEVTAGNLPGRIRRLERGLQHPVGNLGCHGLLGRASVGVAERALIVAHPASAGTMRRRG